MHGFQLIFTNQRLPHKILAVVITSPLRPSVHAIIVPGDGADEAEVEREADGHDGAVEREEGRLPPAHPPGG